MDPATIFQVISGALQIIEFGVRTAKAFHTIYKSKDSLTVEYERLDIETRLLATASSSITSTLQDRGVNASGVSPDQAHIRNVAQECNRLAADLLHRLDQLRLTGPSRKRNIPLQWWKLTREKGKIEKTQSQLGRCQELLNTQALVNLCGQLAVRTAQQKARLQQIDINLIRSLEVTKNMRTEFQNLLDNLLEELLTKVQDEGEKTRKLMRDLDLKVRDDTGYRALLDSIGFPTMVKRQEEVHEAYPQTFEWLLSTKKSHYGRPHVALREWLEKEGGIFWINGKAGSGKSTLMKFLMDHEALKKALETWAAGQELTIATFFFWRATSDAEQKSINGLLRSILHQLLSEHPHLARSLQNMRLEARHWTVERLKTSLSLALQQCAADGISLCLLIDGLDEFEGSEVEKASLVDLIATITQTGRTKAIVSSRPENALFHRLCSRRSLRLQDFTTDDMKVYAKGKLFGEPLIQKLMKEDSRARSQVDLLAQEVVSKADGVFLWASLAMQDLISGIWSKDTLETLEQRLLHLDQSLDGIFEQLLARIHPVHQVTVANYLKFVKYLGEETQYHAKFDFLDKLNVLDIAFACHTDLQDRLSRLLMVDEPARHIDDREVLQIMSLLHDLSTSLRSQCAGLLDVRDDLTMSNNTWELSGGTQLPDEADLLSPLGILCYHFSTCTRVLFVHRSAWEFLQHNSQGRQLLERAAMSEAEIREGITRAYAGSAASNLYLVQDSLHHTVDRKMSSKRSVNPARRLGGIQGQAYRRFWKNINGACFGQHRERNELLLRGSPRPCRTSSRIMQRWVASGLERLSWACERSDIRLVVDDASLGTNWIRLHYKQEISLNRKLEPPQISLVLLIASGCDLQDAMELLAHAPHAAYRPIFDATIFAIAQTRPELVEKSGQLFVFDIAISVVIHGFRLISRLIDLGLELNTVRQDSSSYASFSIPSRGPDPKHATCWESYALIVEWIFRFLTPIAASFEVYAAVSVLTKSFVEHGADMSAQVEFVEAPRSLNDYDRNYGITTVEISAYLLIELWTTRSALIYQMMCEDEQDDKFWSTQNYRVTAIIHSDLTTVAGADRILTVFTDEQQAELRLRLRQYWVACAAQARSRQSIDEDHPSAVALTRSLQQTAVDNRQDVVKADPVWKSWFVENVLYVLKA